MRILFIESGVTSPGNFVYQCYPPHGLMYLASYLRKKQTHHKLKLFDMMIERSAPEDVGKILLDFSPELVAIHAMSFQSSCMHKLANIIKHWNKECFVAVGGPYPSSDTASTLLNTDIDIAGIGEGEETFIDIVNRIEAGDDLTGIPGTAVARDDEIITGQNRPFLEDLDTIPFPAWDLVDLRQYFTDATLNQNDIVFRREVTTIFSSRACPFHCIFCHNMFGKKFRARSVDNVLDEIGILHHEFGIREFHFIDDCFNFKTDRAISILEGILNRNFDLKIAFPNGIRGDKLPDDLLEVMKKAGVYKANFGIESGSPRIQKMIKKGLSLGAVKDGISRAASIGIFTHGFFMMGFPDETKAEMKQTIDFACNSKLHTAGFSLLSPFPGTDVHRLASEKGGQVHFDPDSTSYQKVSANLSAVDDTELKQMHRLAHRKFYSSPHRLYRIIRDLPHPLDLFRVGAKHLKLKFL